MGGAGQGVVGKEEEEEQGEGMNIEPGSEEARPGQCRQERVSLGSGACPRLGV